MVRQKSGIIMLGSVILLFIINVILQGSNRICQDKYVVTIGYDDNGDTTYSIMNSSLKRVVYYGHWNEITLDTIIDNNYIFRENLYLEECSDRFVICHPCKDSLFRAHITCWCFELDEHDFALLQNGVTKALTTESIDCINHTITIKFFNNKIKKLKMETVKY